MQLTFTERELSIIHFAVHRFMNDAYAMLNAAAQDKQNRHFKEGDAERFAKDIKDAKALLEKF